jgi:ferrous iron transport protein B
VHDVASGETINKTHKIKALSPQLERAVSILETDIEAMFPDLPNSRWVALRLLDGDKRIEDAIVRGELGDLHTEPAVTGFGGDPDVSVEAVS